MPSKLLIWLILGFGATVYGAQAPATIKVGSWVTYRVTTTSAQLYFSLNGGGNAGDGGEINTFTAKFRVRQINGDKINLVATLTPPTGNPLVNLIINDFTFAQLLPPTTDNLATAQGKPAVYVFPPSPETAERKIDAVQIILYGAGKKIEIWKSPQVPLGIVQVQCGTFKLELLAYGEADNSES